MDWIFILKSLYFFLPAYFANMAPSFAKRFRIFESLARPVDYGKRYKGAPIFGSHKTWRGVILGTTAGILIAWIQKLLYKFNFFQYISFYNYQKINCFVSWFFNWVRRSPG